MKWAHGLAATIVVVLACGGRSQLLPGPSQSEETGGSGAASSTGGGGGWSAGGGASGGAAGAPHAGGAGGGLGGEGGGGGILSLHIEPEAITMPAGRNQIFVAIPGATSWSVVEEGGGTIDSAGYYVAPET